MSGAQGDTDNAAGGAPIWDEDPFSIPFFDDPLTPLMELRELGAAAYVPKYDIHALGRYEDIRAALGDPATFCSGRGVGLSDFAKEAPWRPPSLILEADPPAHTKTRAVLSRVLSPAVMKELRDGFARQADRHVDALLAKETFDGVTDCAEVYPLSVLPDALGLRRQGREHLLPYGATVFNAFGPDNDLRRAALAAAAPHVEHVAKQCLRENLDPDGLGARIYAAADAGEIPPEAAPMLVRSLLSAGLDTTVHGLGAALYCLARFPEEFEKLRADPSLARNAFEEAVRFESPVQTFFRTTTRRVRIGDAEIGEGRKVLLFFASANRDPRKWERPDAYDVIRQTSGHVGFGSGIHMCVGQLVARLEGEVVLNAIARKARSLEPAGAPVRKYNNTLRGLQSLPLVMKAA